MARLIPSWAKRSTEGQYRPGPYPLSDGWLSAKAGKFWNFWQMGYSVQPYGESGAMVEACVSAYAQTVAMCPGAHWRSLDNGGRVRVSNSALARLLKRPNEYQSISDFMLNLTRRMMEKGEAFALAIRNNRNEISEIHIMQTGVPVIGVDGSIFYWLSGNDIVERRFDMQAPIPARDVLHLRLYTPLHPLRGVSPLLATTLERALSGTAMNQQITFYLNQARPSFMLETDEKLTYQQTEDLRKRWDEQTQGDGAGGTPILSWGLKAKPVSMSAKDTEIADLLKLADQSIALAFRMPLQVLGIGDTPFASTEALMASWKSSGLGFVLNHIEEGIGRLFDLGGLPDEYLEFDTNELMRSNFKDRIEGLSRGVISGIFSPDEARAAESLPSVPGGVGSEPRVQQQVVPLSFGANMKPEPAAAPPASPSDAPAEEPAVEEADDEEATKWAKSDANRAVSALRSAFARNVAA